MAEISLSVYQNKLDRLLEQSHFNEVIAHCRHILVEYPKNLKAYSQMGQALFSASRWDESAELFRRLLGALPNDFVAHYHLGQIYQHLKLFDDAIWHTERAYDQQPNNGDVINDLRTLYKDHRNVDVQRLQLTAGAVAQQHIRNSLYQQAINVLDQALARYPNRVDLKVLRIRALWQAEKHLDAAEGALDVLEQLPYSLIANRILTDLWLMEQRPSDAQRYLSRIEDLDPYMAYRIATGEPPIESLMMIEELDYEAISRHELSTANPDWLNTMDSVEADEVDMSDFDIPDDILSEIDTPAEQPRKVTDDLENLLSDDWGERIDALEGGSEADEDLDALFSDLEDDDLFDEFDDVDEDVDDIFADFEDSTVDDLDDIFGDEDKSAEPSLPSTDELNLPDGMHTDDLPDGLLDRISAMKGMSQQETMPATNRPDIEQEDNSRPSTGLTGMLRQLEEEDDLSWLNDAQQGDFDEGQQAVESAPTIEDSTDSDWLEELESLENSPDAQRTSTGLTGMFDDDDNDADTLDDLLDDLDESEAEALNPDDPTAWMKASGIEFDADAEPENLFALDDDDAAFESADVNPMAWLEGNEPTADPTELDPMAWMNEETGDPDAAASPESVPNFFEEIGFEDNTGDLEPDDDWFGDDEMLDEMLSLEDEMDTSTNQLSDEERILDEIDPEFVLESRELPDQVDESLDEADDDFFDFDDDESPTDQPITDDDVMNLFDDDDDDDESDNDVMNLFDDDDESDDDVMNLFDDDNDDDESDDDVMNLFDDNEDESDDDAMNLFDDDDDDESDDDAMNLFDDEEDDESDNDVMNLFDDDDDDESDNDVMNLFDDDDDDDESDDDVMNLFDDDNDDDDESDDDVMNLFDDDDDDDESDDDVMNLFDDDESDDENESDNDVMNLFDDDDDESDGDAMNLFDDDESDDNDVVETSLPDDDWADGGNFFNDDFADDDADSSLPTNDWVGDDDILDEMLSFEDDDLQFDVDDSVDNTADTSETGDWQGNMNDDFNNDFQPEQPDDDELDPLAWLNDDNEGQSSASPVASDNEEVDLEDMFAQLDDHDFDEGNAGLEWLETDENEIVSDEEAAIPADADPLGWLGEEGVEVTGDISIPIDEDLIIEDEDEDTGSWLDRIDLSEPLPAAEDESVATEAEASWLSDIEADDFATSTDNSELNWLEDDVDDSAAVEGEAQPIDTNDMFDFEAEDDNSQFDFSAAPAVTESNDEPDWLSALDNADDEFIGEDDDEALEEADADWLSDMGNFEDEAEAVADDQPDWLADVAIEAEDEADDIPAAVENNADWLSELGDLEDDDFQLDIDDDDDDEVAEQPEQPDWLAGAGLAANEFIDDDEPADEEADEWLAEIGEFDDEELEIAEQPIAEDEPDWLSGADEFEDDEDELELAEQAVAEDEPDWLSGMDSFEDEEDEELDLANDQPDWLAEADTDDDDELELIEQIEADDEPSWLSDTVQFEDEVADADDEPDWLSGAGDFDEDIVPASKTVTQELDWIEDEDAPAEETAIGATADVDYLDEVDPATAPSALDWMTDVDAEDEVIFDEPIEDQPQGITDFLNNGDDDQEEVAAVAEDDSGDWLSAADEFEDDEAEQPEQPDWLSGAAVAGAGVAAGLAANEFLDDDESDDDMIDFEADDEEFAIAQDEPDWLSAAAEFGADEDAIEDDEADWLSTSEDIVASAIPDDGYDYENDDTIVGRPDLEKPGWLDGMDEGDGVQDAFGEDAADEIDWNDDTQIEEDLVAEAPDWLEGMDEGDGIQDVFGEDAATDTDDEFDFEFAENSGADDNIDAINNYETEAEPDVTYEEDDAVPEFSAEELFGEEAYSDDFEEETEFTPAEAAPDWLNAMVPGLDIDYDAEEDEPVDQGFVGEPQSKSTEKGFDWLTDIVDEETGAMAPVVPKPQPPAAPRFKFSNPPAWLGRLFGGAASAAVIAEDSDYDELPDWLEVDDD